jgi:hypothetical protein
MEQTLTGNGGGPFLSLGENVTVYALGSERYRIKVIGPDGEREETFEGPYAELAARVRELGRGAAHRAGHRPA